MEATCAPADSTVSNSRTRTRCAEPLPAAAGWHEARQLEDRFGLSPLARRRLGWDAELLEDAPPTPRRAAVMRGGVARSIWMTSRPARLSQTSGISTTWRSISARVTASGIGPARTASTAFSASASNMPPADAVTPPTPDRTNRPTCDDRTTARAGPRTTRAGAAPIRPTLEGFSAAPSRSFSDIDSVNFPEAPPPHKAMRVFGR